MAVPCSAQWSGPPFAPESAQLSSGDLKELLQLLCPAQGYIGEQSGCHVCPPQTRAAGMKTDSSIESAIAGHFLTPDSEDLLLTLYGCAPNSENFRSAFLFTRSTTGWFVSQSSGLPSGRCRKLRNRAGRDALVCFSDTNSPDQASGRLTAGYIGDKEKDPAEWHLADAFDNTPGACDAPARPVIQSAIQQVTFVPGAGGKLTLRIVARCRRGPLNARSRKACANGPGFEDIGPALPFRTFRIDYNFNGDAFSLAPLSRASKQAYDACSTPPK